MRRTALRSLPFFLVFSISPDVAAQCQPTWLAGGGVPGVYTSSINDSSVADLGIWDRDGSGPISAQIIVTGPIFVAGNLLANGIAAFDPATRTWSNLGGGINGSALATATMANGDLVVGGDFSSAGGIPANRVARWDGNTWTAIDTGFDGGVSSLLALSNGDLIAGGSFTTASGAPARGIARWNGTTWSEIGGGVGHSTYPPWVGHLIELQNGNLIAAGWFTSAGGVVTNNIARWDGMSWSPLGSGIGVGPMDAVTALTRTPVGDLIAGGRTSATSPVSFPVMRWDGTSWSPLGSGMNAYVMDLAMLPSGSVVAGGWFSTAGGVAAQYVAAWNGVGWQPLAPNGASSKVSCMTVTPNGEIVVGGRFHRFDSAAVANVAVRSGGVWSALGSGTNGPILVVATNSRGETFAGGSFGTIEGTAAAGIARWTGSGWAPLGAGLDGSVTCITFAANNDLIVGGWFANAGGTPAKGVARWNGSTWLALGTGFTLTGMPGGVLAVAELPNGDVVAGGVFDTADGAPTNFIARWTGSTWTTLGSGLAGSMFLAGVRALTVMQNGDLVASGFFSTAGGSPANHIASWNGSTWSTLGSGTNAAILCAELSAAGELLVGGAFSTAGGMPASGVARWDGSAWSSIGNGVGANVHALHRLPDGDLLVGGSFGAAGGAPASAIARWNGVSWSAFGAGIAGNVLAMGGQLAGEVLVGGNFFSAGGGPSPYVARLAPTCPASATIAGAGCPSSGGANSLTATVLPWLGGTFASRASGVPTDALVASVLSAATTILPLASALPQGQAGCVLHVAPDVVQLLVANGNEVDFRWQVPDAVSLVGFALGHQMVVAEIDPQGAIAAITATNALRLTLGVF
jgi:trimeric autotransporter adhesin